MCPFWQCVLQGVLRLSTSFFCIYFCFNLPVNGESLECFQGFRFSSVLNEGYWWRRPYVSVCNRQNIVLAMNAACILTLQAYHHLTWKKKWSIKWHLKNPKNPRMAENLWEYSDWLCVSLLYYFKSIWTVLIIFQFLSHKRKQYEVRHLPLIYPNSDSHLNTHNPVCQLYTHTHTRTQCSTTAQSFSVPRAS